jgi:hypothetical protein
MLVFRQHVRHGTNFVFDWRQPRRLTEQVLMRLVRQFLMGWTLKMF